ncbi:MAG: SUMF1/EgtB/PvdO family nonheme iron enzyme [Vicinamibacteria bacterium]
MDFFVEDGSGMRRFDRRSFPLTIGGQEADIQLPFEFEPSPATPLARLGFSSGEMFVEPAGGSVTVNGAAVSSSYWLKPGDVVHIGAFALEVLERSGALGLAVRLQGEGEELEEPELRSVKPIAFEPKRLEKLRPGGERGIHAFWFAAGIAVLALAAFYLFTSRPVAIEIEPVPDRMDLEGTFLDVAFQGRFLLRPGTYRLVAEKEGYRTLEHTIAIGKDSPATLRFTLERLPGLLAIAVRPEVGASVLIDGKSVGSTPLEPLELSSGEHEVLVRADRYREFSTRIAVDGRGTTATLDVDLAPLWAPVTFLTEPAGATVRVGEQSYGPTPFSVELPEGDHPYRVLVPGKKVESGRVRVVGGEPQTVSIGGLAPADGTLRIVSVPGEASVTIDGLYRGRTPLEVPLTPGTSHRLEVGRAGYETRTAEVEVGSGGEETVTVELSPELGEVEVVADPPDAELFVNGEPRGAGRQTLRLPAVAHRIELRKSGYDSFVVEITPRPDFPQTIEATLVDLEAKKLAEAPKPKIENPAGHDMVLVQGRRFQMGASRREPGRRANEAEREVEITRAFYMGTREVTNRQFREFEEGHRSGRVAAHNLEVDDHPVVRVTWEDGAAYCNWLSERESLPPAYVMSGASYALASPHTTGYRLPTEAEWELSARYAGGSATKYSWGDSLPVPPSAGNFADASADGLVATILPHYDDSFPATAPVGSFAANALGIYHLGGNVAEWVTDHYEMAPADGNAVAKDPVGPAAGEFRVIRGASYLHGSITQLRLTYRDYGKEARPDVGFRVARWVK